MTLPFLEGRILYDTADQMGKAMGDQIFAQQRKNNAFKQYVEAWIHEVKLPIASIAASSPIRTKERIPE